MLSYAAHLRVYEPLSAFPADERRRWATYVSSGRAPDPGAGAEAEHTAALAALLAMPPRPAPLDGDEHAFVHQLDGTVYICPWQTRLRCWESMFAFRRGLPDELADAFIPPAVAAGAEHDYAEWQASHPGARARIITSTWQVPLPWFVLFDEHERRLMLGARRSSPTGAGARTGTARVLVYLTAMSRARQRTARALRVLRRTLEDGPAVAGLEDLGSWLEEFHPHALVELDYGGLVHLLGDDELAGDDSVPALAAALAELAKGDATAAAGLYQKVAIRWRKVAILENAN